MKLKKNLSESLTPGNLDAVNLLKEITDILLVCNTDGKILFTQSSTPILRQYSDMLSELVKDSDKLALIGKGGYTENLSIPEGKIKVRCEILDTNNEQKILLVGNFFSDPKRCSLLWDSFINKEPFVFSSIVELLTGYTSEQLNNFSGRGFNLLIPEEAEEMKRIISGFIVDKTRDMLELVYRINSKDGKILWLKEVILAERQNTGNIINYSASLAELTSFIEDKLSKEEALTELQQLNNAKDQFISVLSHDLKSPYTSILGFSEILLNESALSTDERTEYLSYINLSSQNQLKLINNLLEWSRLITGRKHLDTMKLNLKNIINDIVSNNTRIIHKKELDVKLTADNYIYVEADERLLTEAFNIVISNAIKYSNPGKSIEIFLNRFRENQIEVIVKDEGIGISEKNKSRILKMDKIFSTPGTSGERGTGMSLLLADEIIKSHKGEMWFYSEEGAGSEFHFTLPSSGNTILLVDTDESEKQKIGNMLKAGFPGFRLSVERNFYNALGKIRKDNPAILIISHKLPFMNGMEFIKTLKKEERFVTTPIIVYSGELNEKMIEEYRELGVIEVLSSPVNLKVLKEKVEQNLK